MRVLALTVAALLGLATPAHALPILSPADAADLEEQLKEAGDAMGVCFGWSAQIVGAASGLDAGGALPGSCARSLTLDATITYTSESSESEDSAQAVVAATGFPESVYPPPGELTGRGPGELTGDDDDRALYELVAALPLYAAELDPALGARLPAIEPGTPAEGAQVGKAGSDWLREHGLTLAFGAGLAAAAAFFVLSGLAQRRTRST